MTYSYQTTRKACYLGSIIQAITVNVPPVFFVIFQEDYGISYAQLGTLILLTFVVQIVVDLCWPRWSTVFTREGFCKRRRFWPS